MDKYQRGGAANPWLIAILVAASLFGNAWQYAHRAPVIHITLNDLAPVPYIHPPHVTKADEMLKLATPEPAKLTTFPTMNEAAVKALEYAYHLSHYYEVGGTITKIDGKFAIGAPDTDFSGDSLAAIDMDPMHYHGEIVANYHTHPCNNHTHVPALFSTNDMHSDRSFKSIGYIADLCTGKVHKYDPSIDHVTMAEAMMTGWEGPVVGQFAVDGVSLDPNTTEMVGG